MPRTLVAGIGNIFLGDDGFGVEVAQRLAHESLPDGARAADFGIRTLHLAYELLDGGYDTTILVDATARGGTPGTVYLIEPEVDGGAPPSPADGHSITPEALLATLKTLGGTPGRMLIVGCEPASLEEGIGLSEPVAAAVNEAAQLVRELLARQSVSEPVNGV
jgi:hydrogenase maturation protease